MVKILSSLPAKEFIKTQIEEIRNKVGKKNVLLAVSGGVDSAVVAVLLSKAIGKHLFCIHIDSGLMRIGESEQVEKVFKKNFNINFKRVNASKIFLSNLKNVADPERKRKIIGKTFIDVFASETKNSDIDFLAQGTIYPDVSESKDIKSHHNVGGLPKKMKFALVEPLKTLYKDEVRVIGKELGLPDEILFRQPFPGPGLGVRCIGKITPERLEILKKSDQILREEFKKNNLSAGIWQFFTIISDVKRIGIRDEKRFLGFVIIIRAVNSVDATKATPCEIPFNILNNIVKRIIKELPSVSRVVYDLTPKPCGTIEWE